MQDNKEIRFKQQTLQSPPLEKKKCALNAFLRVFEDSGLCALELARVLMVFAGDAMLPTRPWVKMDSSALRVLAGAGLSCCETRKVQLLAGPQKVG